MSNEDFVTPNEAQAALDEVADLQGRSTEAAEPSRLTTIAFATIAGLMVATPMVDNSGTMVAVLAGAIAMVASNNQSKSRVVGALGISASWSGALKVFGLLAFAVVFYGGGLVLRDRFDLTYGPLLAGIAATATILALTLRSSSEAK